MIKYTASNFRNECTVDEDFIPYLDKMNEVAIKYGVTVIVTSSYRIDANVVGAIVHPATHSNHMIGHAVDCNLEHEGMYYNSTKMLSDVGVIKTFIEQVEATGMRWGGRFKHPDSVHFDDALNIKNIVLWTTKYNLLHNRSSVVARMESSRKGHANS